MEKPLAFSFDCTPSSDTSGGTNGFSSLTGTAAASGRRRGKSEIIGLRRMATQPQGEASLHGSSADSSDTKDKPLGERSIARDNNGGNGSDTMVDCDLYQFTTTASALEEDLEETNKVASASMSSSSFICASPSSSSDGQQCSSSSSTQVLVGAPPSAYLSHEPCSTGVLYLQEETGVTTTTTPAAAEDTASCSSGRSTPGGLRARAAPNPDAHSPQLTQEGPRPSCTWRGSAGLHDLQRGVETNSNTPCGLSAGATGNCLDPLESDPSAPSPLPPVPPFSPGEGGSCHTSCQGLAVEEQLESSSLYYSRPSGAGVDSELPSPPDYRLISPIGGRREGGEEGVTGSITANGNNGGSDNNGGHRYQHGDHNANTESGSECAHSAALLQRDDSGGGGGGADMPTGGPLMEVLAGEQSLAVGARFCTTTTTTTPGSGGGRHYDYRYAGVGRGGEVVGDSRTLDGGRTTAVSGRSSRRSCSLSATDTEQAADDGYNNDGCNPQQHLFDNNCHPRTDRSHSAPTGGLLLTTTIVATVATSSTTGGESTGGVSVSPNSNSCSNRLSPHHKHQSYGDKKHQNQQYSSQQSSPSHKSNSLLSSSSSPSSSLSPSHHHSNHHLSPNHHTTTPHGNSTTSSRGVCYSSIPVVRVQLADDNDNGGSDSGERRRASASDQKKGAPTSAANTTILADDDEDRRSSCRSFMEDEDGSGGGPGGGGLQAIDLEELQRRAKQRRKRKSKFAKNTLILSFAFVMLFSATSGLTLLQSSLNRQMGVFGLLGNFAAVAVSCLLLPKALIQLLGCKWTIVFSMSCFMFWIMSNLHPTWGTLIPTAVVMGTGWAPLWTAQCTYFTITGIEYAKWGDDMPDVVIARMFGIFFMIFMTAPIWGNLLSSSVLSTGFYNRTRPLPLPGDPESIYRFCGAADCPETFENSTNENYNRPSVTVVWTLVSIYLGLSVIGLTLVAFFLDGLELDREAGKPRCAPVSLMASFKQMANPYQIFIIPLTVYTGMEQVFLMVEYTRAYATCALGIEKIGYVVSSYAAVAALMSLTCSQLVNVVGRMPLFLIGAGAHIGCMVVFMRWTPYPDSLVMFIIMPALWGIGDAIWQSQINAFYGVLFSDQSEAAFSNYRMWESVGFIVSLSYSPFMCVFRKIHVLLGMLISGIVGYFVVEGLYSKASSERETELAKKGVIVEAESAAQEEEEAPFGGVAQMIRRKSSVYLPQRTVREAAEVMRRKSTAFLGTTDHPERVIRRRLSTFAPVAEVNEDSTTPLSSAASTPGHIAPTANNATGSPLRHQQPEATIILPAVTTLTPTTEVEFGGSGSARHYATAVSDLHAANTFTNVTGYSSNNSRKDSKPEMITGNSSSSCIDINNPRRNGRITPPLAAMESRLPPIGRRKCYDV